MQHLDDGELTAHLDGQTGGRADGQEHLATCAECQARLEALRVTRERAQAILRSGTPSGAQLSFQDILKRRAAKTQARRLANLRPLAWAATVVLALGVGWYARELTVPVPEQATLASEMGRTGEAGGTGRLVADSAPKLAARPAPVIHAQREAAAEPKEDLQTRAKAAANVAADRKDEAPRAPAPVEIAAATPSAQPLVRSFAEDDQLKKANARDTMRVNLDAVVVTAIESRAAETVDAPRRARQAAAGPPAAAPVSARAEARGFVDARAATAEWTRVDVSAATRVLDRAPFIAPGLEVVEYQVNPGRTSVRVTQRLNTGILELIQQRAGVKEESGPSASRAVTGPGIGALVDGIQLRLWGPVSYDSLRALVAKLK